MEEGAMTEDELAQVREWFVDAISNYSEERWCAGWLIGIEEIIREEGGPWLWPAGLARGWPLGYRGEDGWDPLTEDEQDAFDRMIEELRA